MRSGAKRVDMCTKPTSFAITLVHSPYGSTHACVANQYGVQRTFTIASPGRFTSNNSSSDWNCSSTIRARCCEITSGAGNNTSYTRQSSDFQRKRRYGNPFSIKARSPYELLSGFADGNAT